MEVKFYTRVLYGVCSGLFVSLSFAALLVVLFGQELGFKLLGLVSSLVFALAFYFGFRFTTSFEKYFLIFFKLGSWAALYDGLSQHKFSGVRPEAFDEINPKAKLSAKFGWFFFGFILVAATLLFKGFVKAGVYVFAGGWVVFIAFLFLQKNKLLKTNKDL